jgi:hypothetical protein
MTSDSDRVVVNFPTTGEEHARRILAEAQRLANLAPGEWRLWINNSAERLGASRTDLEGLVKATIESKEKEARERKAEERRQEQLLERQRTAAERAERKQESEQRRIDKEAEQKRKQKQKALAALVKLPSDQHEAHLAELARSLGEDVAVLREEFEAFSGGELSLGDLLIGSATPTPATWNVMPWDEPVDVALLLQEINDKIRKYAVLDEHYLTALVLWIPMDWVHNEIATHSPFLDVGSVDEGSGKTLLLWLLFFLSLRPCLGADFTSANIYRTADHDQPTMIIDESDEAFEDRQLGRIVNASWTRGEKIPRQVYDRTTKEWRTYWFNVFCPKVFGHVLLPPAKPLPRTIARRCISVKIWPKRENEYVEKFGYCDDNEFATLRRKLLRFANDQAKAIAEIEPTFPAGFNNSVSDNWELLLSIAELAGGDWPNRAHKAAEFIAGKLKGSQGSQLFEAFHAMCIGRLKGGAAEIAIPSEEAVAFLKDFDPYWATDYRGSDGHPGEITQSKLAALLRNYEISPEKSTRGRRPRGYVIFDRGRWSEQWLNMFTRYCPRVPDIRSNPPNRKKK